MDNDIDKTVSSIVAINYLAKIHKEILDLKYKLTNENPEGMDIFFVSDHISSSASFLSDASLHLRLALAKLGVNMRKFVTTGVVELNDNK